MTNRLIEIALKNSLQSQSDFKFNFNNLTRPQSLEEDILELPIEPEQSKWEKVDLDSHTFINRTFKFMKQEHLLFFVNELVKKSNVVSHHPAIIIEHDKVSVELYTHDINDVTQLDLDMAKFADEIYGDILFINR